jgi:small subunit ribosomal protein S1
MEKINCMVTTNTPVGPNSGADVNPMLALLDSDYGMSMPSRGEIREGVIARVTPSEILIDVGAKSEGVINGRELDSLDEATRKGLQIGQTLLVYVMDPEDRNGNIVLSLTRAREEQDWRDAEALLASQDVYAGSVAGFNKGGLIVKLGNVRGFVPASQLGPSRRRRSEGDTPEQKWAHGRRSHAGQGHRSRPRRNRPILSEPPPPRSREAQKTGCSASQGRRSATGHVISLADFGALSTSAGPRLAPL